MKKIYEKPTIEEEIIEIDDVCTTSGDYNETNNGDVFQ